MPNLNPHIIVSADDFGKNPQTNANIFELLNLKKLERVSIMIEGVFSPEEIYSLLNSEVKIDLHLDLSGLRKNNGWQKNESGIFSRLTSFLISYLSGEIDTPNVAKHWTEQMEKFRAIFGRYPDGLNSHEHIHFFPPYFKLISNLAQKKGISYLRFGEKDFFKISKPISLIIFSLKKINRQGFLNSGLNSADFLISLDWLKENNFKDTAILPYGNIELIIHPERIAELERIKKYTLRQSL